MRVHPLTAYVGRIDPAERYTIADIAEMTGRAYSTVGRWAAGGHLGEGEQEVPPDLHHTMGTSVTRRVWTGEDLLSAVHAPRPRQDHADRTPGTTWRLGCRVDAGCGCAQVHNRATTAARRAAADAAFTSTQRRRLMTWLARGMAIDRVAVRVGVSERQIWGLAQRDSGFRTRLDEALMAGRDPGIRHGTDWAYRTYRCRCPECRATKARYR